MSAGGQGPHKVVSSLKGFTVTDTRASTTYKPDVRPLGPNASGVYDSDGELVGVFAWDPKATARILER